MPPKPTAAATTARLAADDQRTQTCGHCQFSDLNRELGLWTCHRYAPRPELAHESASPGAEWPAVFSTDWCGEFVRWNPDTTPTDTLPRG